MTHISIISPVYNAANCIEELYRQIKQNVETITQDYEIIFVEDMSSDNTWGKVEQLARSDGKLKCIKFSRNFGQHYAISAGIDYSSGEWIIVMDCDLQDPPSEIPRLYKKAQEGYDIVFALRENRKDSKFKLMWGNIFIKIFNILAEMKIDRRIGNFSIINRKVADNVIKYKESLRNYVLIVNRVGFATTFHPIEHQARYQGKSSYNFSKNLKLALHSIISNTDKPLYLLAIIGGIISLFSFCYGVFLIIEHFVTGHSVEGWASLMVSIYFLSGTILSALGITGIYIGKIFQEVRKQPLYIIDKKINCNDSNKSTSCNSSNKPSPN